MTEADRLRLLRSPAQIAAVVLCAALGLALFTFVDLTPRIEGDFFFSTDDPQLRESLRIEEEFGSAPQLLVAVRSASLVSREYLIGLRDLTLDLQRVPGVADVRSLASGPQRIDEIAGREPGKVFEKVEQSPFWSRLLLAPDRSATFLVLRLEEDGHEATISGVDAAIERHRGADFEPAVSGVPYVSEHIRRQLTRDLRFFSIAAFVAFAVLVALLFRSLAVVVGTLVAALTACFATFLVRALFGMRTDVLTPNLWTIAFVLTLSHVVYVTAQWRLRAREVGGRQAVRESMRLVAPASAWSLAANLLGFASLVFVSAKPLREFGLSGVIAALVAMVCAYVAFPPFLRSAAPGPGRSRGLSERLHRFFISRHRALALAVIACALALAPFAWRVETDPSLPSYFARGSRIRTGLEAIDRAGGSSPLDLVVADERDRGLDSDEAFRRLEGLQQRLERHPEVGNVMSIALLMAETERRWYSFLFSWERRLERLESPKHDRVARTFISEDRRRGRFILRMREEQRTRPRAEVVREIEEIVREAGFRPLLVGGLYPLQGELSILVEASVIRGLGGLIALFAVIVLIVTRSLRTTLAMALCLLLTPFALFGCAGLAGMPVDIISAPAANVALPLGIDEMIHLGHRVRRLRRSSGDRWGAWQEALGDLWRPIVASMLIVASGFSLFLLSNSPPTRRLGLLVCIGALLTDLVVLVVLPAVATWRLGATRRGEQS